MTTRDLIRPAEVIASAGGGMSGFNSKTLEAWGKLTPTDDDRDPRADPHADLLLSTSDCEALTELAAVLAEATVALTKMEQELAAAERMEMRLPRLQSALTTATADAFVESAGALERLHNLREDIDEASIQAKRLPVLRELLTHAQHARGQAFGALRTLARKQIEGLRCRAAVAWADAACRLSKAAAAIDASFELDRLAGNEHSVGWHAHTLSVLNVPALPLGVRVGHQGVSQMHYRDSLLAAQHPRFALQRTAAKGSLERQISTAVRPAGLVASNLL
jgi:hypothetical protein